MEYWELMQRQNSPEVQRRIAIQNLPVTKYSDDEFQRVIAINNLTSDEVASLMPARSGKVGPALVEATPALPHPDASNQELGPNLGGSDAVTTMSDAAEAKRQAATTKAGLAGAGLIVAGLVLLVLFGGN